MKTPEQWLTEAMTQVECSFASMAHLTSLFAAAIAEARADEREGCIAVLRQYDRTSTIEAAIRARGGAK